MQPASQRHRALSEAPENHRIASDALTVEINAHGAELTSIVHRTAGEVMWQAGPVWPQHAPNLFPIVGQLVDDRYPVAGRFYSLKRHGFARLRRFDWLATGIDACTLVLRDDAQTQALYPFAFELTIAYTVRDAMLNVTYVVKNTGSAVLPASLGAHPAFAWPLPGVADKAAYTLTFERDELQPIRRLQAGLLKLDTEPTPVVGRVLALNERLFAADAIIIDRLASRSVRYGAPGTAHIDVAWDGFQELGVWSKPGDFVCIEPWRGFASPINFEGPLEDKPGIMLVPPGEAQTLSLSISVIAA